MVRLSIHSISLLVGCIILPIIIGVIGSYYTATEIPGWYESLVKPWFNPPAWIFAPVWTALYIMMGISLWFFIRDGVRQPVVLQGIAIYGIQLCLNLFWSVIFFGMHFPAGGLITIILLILFILATIRIFYKKSVYAAYLLIPYLCWVCFASLLNAMIVYLN